jgi:hypothetical protein
MQFQLFFLNNASKPIIIVINKKGAHFHEPLI